MAVKVTTLEAIFGWNRFDLWAQKQIEPISDLHEYFPIRLYFYCITFCWWCVFTFGCHGNSLHDAAFLLVNMSDKKGQGQSQQRIKSILPKINTFLVNTFNQSAVQIHPLRKKAPASSELVLDSAESVKSVGATKYLSLFTPVPLPKSTGSSDRFLHPFKSATKKEIHTSGSTSMSVKAYK